MKKLTFSLKLKMWWHGLKLKPSRMMGDSGKCTWVVASSHPPYSITWTWAIYWTKPSCWRFKIFCFKSRKEKFSIRSLLTLGFSLSTQSLMLRDEFKKIW